MQWPAFLVMSRLDALIPSREESYPMHQQNVVRLHCVTLLDAQNISVFAWQRRRQGHFDVFTHLRPLQRLLVAEQLDLRPAFGFRPVKVTTGPFISPITVAYKVEFFCV